MSKVIIMKCEHMSYSIVIHKEHIVHYGWYIPGHRYRVYVIRIMQGINSVQLLCIHPSTQ